MSLKSKQKVEKFDLFRKNIGGQFDTSCLNRLSARVIVIGLLEAAAEILALSAMVPKLEGQETTRGIENAAGKVNKRTIKMTQAHDIEC